MNIITSITDDRKHLLEKRMLNQDQHQYLSPPHQQPLVKVAHATSSKNDEHTASTAAEPSASLSIMEEKGGMTDANGTFSSNIIGKPKSAESSALILADETFPQTALVTVATVAASSMELQDADESKGDSSKSQSHSFPSPTFKVEKEKEHKGDIQVKSLKRSHNTIESRSPKLAKNEENNHADHTTAVNQDTGSRGATTKTRTILSYFTAQGEHPNGTLSGSIFPPTSASTSSTPFVTPSNSSVSTSNDASVIDLSTGSAGISPNTTNKSNQQKSSFQSNNAKTSASFSVPAAINPEIKKQLEMLRASKEQAENKTLRTEADLKAATQKLLQVEERNTRLCKALEDIHRSSAMQDARKRRSQLAQDCVRLGKIVSMRMGPTNVQDVWEEGYALNELKRRSVELLEKKEEFEKRRKKLQNLKRAAKKVGPQIPGSSSSSSSSNLAMSAPEFTDDEPYELDLDLAAESEAIRTHLEQLKKDESGLLEEKRILEGEKAAHQKEIKRCQSEDRSRFNRDLPCLNSRYVLVSMLGRGGFSEVWKALDLVELREVAVKVHQLNPVWSEEHKQRYIKNVTREYKIHREMRHPRVVDFYDVFEIDVNSFATVLEYCRGIDLDEKLKRCRVLPEREARTVLMQIISGLRYLNTPGESTGGSGMGDEEGGEGSGSRRKAIIHYDLKPANILFDEMGDAKITDFGLSKIIDDSHDGTSMELTSQGAGTYWYLPPECFVGNDARISSKVDVWSVGVIFYQMLFGKRPFGEGKSQERVLSEGIILNATQVEFPPASDTRAPKIPDDAKDLIRACLTADQKFRPDVHALCQHPYLRNSR